MADENKVLWKRQSKNRFEAALLARTLDQDWLQGSVAMHLIRFTGSLGLAIEDLIRSTFEIKKNPPTRSLRLSLQSGFDGVFSVDPSLGFNTRRQAPAIALLESGLDRDEIAAKVLSKLSLWTMNSLAPWAERESLGHLCVAIDRAIKSGDEGVDVIAENRPFLRQQGASNAPDYPLICRMIAERLAGIALFEGLPACDLVLTAKPDSNTIDLMTAPHTAVDDRGRKSTFSMIAQIHVSSTPVSPFPVFSISCAKRVWASKLPDGGNTGVKATAYVLPPARPAMHVEIIRHRVGDEVQWDFSDEYSGLYVDSEAGLPASLDSAFPIRAFEADKWWVGIPQITRLYRRVDPHTAFESDEVALMDAVMPRLAGILGAPVPISVKRVSVNRKPESAMLKLSDLEIAGLAPLDEDQDDQNSDDFDVDSEGEQASNPADDSDRFTNFRNQCVRALHAARGEQTGALWILGGTIKEREIAKTVATTLFSDALDIFPEPLPANVHGLRRELPGSELKTKQRFNLRVQAWKDSGLPQMIAQHPGPRFVLICADKEIGRKSEDSVNRRAAIHAICALAGASVHHLLPTENPSNEARRRDATQAFLHRCQSALMDMTLAHSGYVLEAGQFVNGICAQSEAHPSVIYGVQVLRKERQQYTGEIPVSMLVYTRLRLADNITQICFSYKSGSKTMRSDWKPLSEGLIWLGALRENTGDDAWLKEHFARQTLEVLTQADGLDPGAIVMIDWGTVGGLWKDLGDADLKKARPTLLGQSLATSFPNLTLLRLRYGMGAHLPLRSISRTLYATENEVGAPAVVGQSYTDVYATPKAQLAELYPDKSSKDLSHFVCVMGARNTFQLKRGLSCYRSVTRMKKVPERDFHERVVLSPSIKDGIIPAAMDITVLQCAPGMDPTRAAMIAMGLRVGYPHYNDWTLLPAPLFFARKIDDYIIKYPTPELEEGIEDLAASSLATADESASQADNESVEDSESLDVSENPTILLWSNVAQQELNLHFPEDAEEPAAALDTIVPAPNERIADKSAVPSHEPSLPIAATAEQSGAIGPVSMAPEPPGILANILNSALPGIPPLPDTFLDLKTVAQPDKPVDAELIGDESDRSLLANAKKMPVICLVGSEATKSAQQIYSNMIRGRYRIFVGLPYFVHTRGFFGSYSPAMKKRVQRSWRGIQNYGLVEPNQQRREFGGYLDWLADKMRHPQGAMVTPPNVLFNRYIIVPKIHDMVIAYNDSHADEEQIRPFDPITSEFRISLSAITRDACAANDDQSLAWLVFAAAQTPNFGLAASVINAIDRIPGKMTRAALHYYLRCGEAVQFALDEGRKKPIEISLDSGFDPGEDLSQPIVPAESPETAHGSQPSHSQNVSVIGHREPISPLEAKIMEIKDQIKTLVDQLAPGSAGFAAQVENILTSIERIREIDREIASDREIGKKIDALESEACALISRISALDEEALIGRVAFTRPDESNYLSAMGDFGVVEANVLVAEEKGRSQHAAITNMTTPGLSKKDLLRITHEVQQAAADLESAMDALKVSIAASVYFSIAQGLPDGPADPSEPGRDETESEKTPEATDGALAGAEVAPVSVQVAPAKSAVDKTSVPAQTKGTDLVPAEQPEQPASEAQVLPVGAKDAEAVLQVAPTPEPAEPDPEPSSAHAPTQDVPANETAVAPGESLVDNPALQHDYRTLQLLMSGRYYALAAIYVDAIQHSFDDPFIDCNCAILRALADTLDGIDCGSRTDVRLNARLRALLNDIDNAPGLKKTSYLGMFAAGITAALFSADSLESDVERDALWTVIGPVRQPLKIFPAVSELIDHIVLRETNGVSLTREKLALSAIGDKVHAEKINQRDRDRARSWKRDDEINANFAHQGFAKMHDLLYGPNHAIGKCLALLADGKIDGLKRAFEDASVRFFKKPHVTVHDAYRAVGEKKNPDGRYNTNAIENIETTERFIRQYLERSTNASSGQQAVQSHEMRYMDTLHGLLVKAIDELKSSCDGTGSLERIYVHGAICALESVRRLYDDTPARVCVTDDTQRLLIQAPMGRDLYPSMIDDGGVPEVVTPEVVIKAIDILVADDLTDEAEQKLKTSVSDEEMAEMLNEALASHIEKDANRYLPAFHIEQTLGGALKIDPPLAQRYKAAKAELTRRLQEARQRVTHAMSLSALDQTEAMGLLRVIATISSLNEPAFGIGHPDSKGLYTYPDFPHAYQAIDSQVTSALEARLEAAKNKLLSELAAYEVSVGGDALRDTARIRQMMKKSNPASIRTAHDAFAILSRGGKLPAGSIGSDKIPPLEYEEFLNSLKPLHGSQHLVDIVDGALKATSDEGLPEVIRNLTRDQRDEAAQFLRFWREICSQRGNNAAEYAGQFFASLGIAKPQYLPDRMSRSEITRFDFPQNAFASLLTECFIPPALGADATDVTGVAMFGIPQESDIARLVHDAVSPTFILLRSSMSLEKRAKYSIHSRALIIDDNLALYMALHPEDRARRMMEIVLLTFYTIPYSAEGNCVAREMFFGRQKELNSLRNVRNLAILYGGRRLGKSSLLRQVEREQSEIDGSIGIYIPLTNYDGEGHVLYVWRKLYGQMLAQGLISQMPSGQSDEWMDYSRWVEAQLIAPQQKYNSCYLMFDEADDMMAYELDLPAGETGFVRSLQHISESVNHRFKLRFVIAGLHNTARMTTEVNSALGKAETIALEPFTSDDDIRRGIELVTKPMAALGFYFTEDSDDLPLRILSLCNFYPSFIQIYCRKLLEQLYNSRGRKSYQTIKVNDLDSIEKDHDLLSGLQEQFGMTLALDLRYKAIALILGDAYYSQSQSGINDGLSVSDIRDLCELMVPLHFAGLSHGGYEGLLDEMRKLTVLDKTASNKYRLRNPSIAMLLGDQDRIGDLLAELMRTAPTKARNHGDRRIELTPIGRSRPVDGHPLFPMPVAWVSSQLGQLDENIIVVCGNYLSGIHEILRLREDWGINLNDVFRVQNIGVSMLAAQITRIRRAGASALPKNKQLIMVHPGSWKTTEIRQYCELAARASGVGVKIALGALPDRMYELAKKMDTDAAEQDTPARDDWSVEPIPQWSMDSLRFYLQDNSSVSQNTQACEAILYASCGFGREIQAICTPDLTVERAIAQRQVAEREFARNKAVFYSKIGLPATIESSTLERMEEFLTLIHGEVRSGNSNMIAYMHDLGLANAHIRLLQWMGLLQESNDNRWVVPDLYRRLLGVQ